MMVIGGVQLVMIGVLGEYIGKLLSEIKGAAGLFRRRAQRDGRRGRDAAKTRTASRAPRARPSERSPAARRIWLCADDYGIAPGVNDGDPRLIARGRINATSVMVVAPPSRARRPPRSPC